MGVEQCHGFAGVYEQRLHGYKRWKIVDVSTRQNKNGSNAKIFAGDFLSNIIQIFPHVYSTQVIGGFPDDKIDMSLSV